MATILGLIQRARLEISDLPTPFICQPVGDGVLRIFEMPVKPIDALTLDVASANPAYVPAYAVDERNGVLTFDDPIPDGTTLIISGTASRFFTEAEWENFTTTAALQHLHNRTGVNLANMDPVEEYPLALLAVTEALYVLINDAAFDIDISTPEGVGIPRHQRYEQLMEMLVARLDQYNRLSAALNVGLGRIEMFDLRRKSRTTNKFVPIYITQEFEDTRFPVRVYPSIDTNGSTPVRDSIPDVPITLIQGEPYSIDLTLPVSLVGSTVKVTLRKYKASGSFRYFDVVVTNAPTGALTTSISAEQTYTLGGGPYWWDVRVVTNGISKSYLEGPVTIEERPRT